MAIKFQINCTKFYNTFKFSPVSSEEWQNKVLQNSGSTIKHGLQTAAAFIWSIQVAKFFSTVGKVANWATATRMISIFQVTRGCLKVKCKSFNRKILHEKTSVEIILLYFAHFNHSTLEKSAIKTPQQADKMTSDNA